MTLTSGDQLGPYVIVGPLGAGGMGEAYRARDTRLGRDVAVKVLTEHAAGSHEPRARLEREARLIASLNHPNICTLFDVGRKDATDYLVMEWVQGETIAARLARGPMPLDDVIRFGAEIAAALQFAHRAGILHRDLKPANVMITREGSKLMDFGLARRSRSPAIQEQKASQSPTESARLTGAGQVVGTLQYLAPEQLEGAEGDVRSDIWALGATLYEMATGRPAFSGKSHASLISAIMREEPRPLAELAPMSPRSLERLIHTCLAKDPDERWQSAGDVARELRWMASEARTSEAVRAEGPQPVVASRRRNWQAASLGAGLLLVACLCTFALLGRTPWWATNGNDDAIRTQIALPNGISGGPRRGDFALSPDGRSVAITIADSAGTPHLEIRRLDLSVLVPLGGPAAYRPFWSPDSREVAFVTAENRLVKMNVSGGQAETICDSVPDFVSGAWGKGSWIVFSRSAGPIMRVRDSGGRPEPVTRLDAGRHEASHEYPEFLPDGRHFTYLTSPPLGPGSYRTCVGSVDGQPGHDLMTVQHAPWCDGRGWLVFMRDRALLAQRVDQDGRGLIGDPVSVPEIPERLGDIADPIVSVTPTTLLFMPEDTRSIELTWYSRDGAPLQHIMNLEPHSVTPSLSPDGRRVVFRAVQGGETWVIAADLGSGTAQRLTDQKHWNSWPTWSAAGNEIVFASSQSADGRSFEVRRMDPDAPGSNHVIGTFPQPVDPIASLPDGHQLIVSRYEPDTGANLYLVDLTQGWNEKKLVASPADETDGVIVSGGAKIVFASNAAGHFDLYLADFPDVHRITRLTRSGCEYGWNRHVVWAAGNGLIYCGLDGRTLHSLQLQHAGDEWRAGEDRALFTLPANTRGACPSPDGRRILVMTPDEKGTQPMLTVVQNWQLGLSSR